MSSSQPETPTGSTLLGYPQLRRLPVRVRGTNNSKYSHVPFDLCSYSVDMWIGLTPRFLADSILRFACIFVASVIPE